jgi:hypothetical protein
MAYLSKEKGRNAMKKKQTNNDERNYPANSSKQPNSCCMLIVSPQSLTLSD